MTISNAPPVVYAPQQDLGIYVARVVVDVAVLRYGEGQKT